METTGEETKAQESARGGARPLGRAGAQRGQKARQPRKRAQGRTGQKPQEDAGRPAQRPPAAARTAQENLNAVIAAIRARFGCLAIGFGHGGIRYSAPVLR
jgi:hypothetical protein